MSATETSVIVYRRKAYVSVRASLLGGRYHGNTPAYEADLTARCLAESLERVSRGGDPWAERLAGKQRVTVFAEREWSIPTQGTAWYNISWRRDGPILYMSRADKNGVVKDDPKKTHRFPRGTSGQEIANAILEDAATRPELKNVRTEDS